MPRCLKSVTATTLALALPALFTSFGATAQAVRDLPLTSLRGEAVFGQPPDVLLNKQPVRLAPGARIRGQNNMLVLSGSLVGQKQTVNYTIDHYGLLKDVWLLREEEADSPWPKTPEDAAKWAWDPVRKVWIKP
jgi:hypothetical protein